MIDLQQKIKLIEAERQEARTSIKKLTEELDKLTGTSPSFNKQLDAYHLYKYNERPQPNLEISRNKTRNIAAAPLSQVPRFMRPTVCSRRKSGLAHLTSEETVRVPAKRRRPMDHHANSVNFPLKGTSESNSECSISRNSCLVALKVKSSADCETEYSQDLSESDTKEVVLPGQEASPKPYVDKWLLLNNNANVTRSHFHRNKWVPAIPTPEKKHICNGQKETDNLQDKKVHNYKFAMKQIINHNKLEKHACVEGSQRSVQEVVINKTPTNLKDYDSISSRCNYIKDKLDGMPMEKHICNTIYPSDIWCSSSHLNEDDNGVHTSSTTQALLGETECSDSALSSDSNWCQISTANSAYSVLDSRKESSISVLRIELKSCCQQLCTAICAEDCGKEDWDTLFKRSAEGIRPGLGKMRCQRALFTENATPKEPTKPQQPIKSQEDDMNSGKKDTCVNTNMLILFNLFYQYFHPAAFFFGYVLVYGFTSLSCSIFFSGICHHLKQKIQILWISTLLGLGLRNLGLEQEFFLGLML